MPDLAVLHDKDIREPLFAFLEATYGKVRILEEKITGSARADAVMVLESLVIGIEIKSDADTYARLASQVRNYDQFYDANFVVIGLSHLRHIEEHVPDWWGIITAEMDAGKPDFYIERHPAPNPKQDPKKKMSILWRPELNRLLARSNLPAYKQKSKQFVADVLLERVNRDVLWRMVSDELFERDYTTIAREISAYRKEQGLKRRRTNRTRPRRKTAKKTR